MNLKKIDKELHKVILIQEGLIFKSWSFGTEKEKNLRFEVRRGSAFFCNTDTLEEANSISEELNILLMPYITQQIEIFKRKVQEEFLNDTVR